MRRLTLLVAVLVAVTAPSVLAAGVSSSHPAQVSTPAERLGPDPRASASSLLISDSAWLSLYFYGADDAVRGFPAELALASCRRRVETSCKNYNGYVPPTLLDALMAQGSNTGFTTLIVATGYNDSDWNFERDFRKIVTTARQLGYQQVVWLTLRVNNVTYTSPDQAGDAEVFRNNNATLQRLVSSGEFPDVVIADWATYAADENEWFSSGDGIHLTKVGAYAAADYISRKITSLHGWPCPVGIDTTKLPAPACPNPDATATRPDIASLYPLTRPYWEFSLDWTGRGSWPDPPWWETTAG